MVNVAVAGGTGGIGRTIVETLVEQGKHKVVILSRKATTLSGLETIPVLEVNYSDQTATKHLLQEQNIDIVVSALALFTPEAAQSQLDLISAAIASTTVSRFIPSEYGINYSHPGLLDFHPNAKWWLDAADLLRSSHLDFTRLIFGWLSDHYGYPKCKSHMKPFKFAVDFDNRIASLPGHGDALVTFLHSRDIAGYVAALIGDARKWPETSAFASDRMSWNELVRLSEDIMGEKWTVTYEPLEKLEKGQATLLKQHPEGTYGLPDEALIAITSEYGIMAVKGVMDVSREGLRNDGYPEVKPLTVKSIIKEAWGKNSA